MKDHFYMPDKKNIDRRQFLKTAASAAAAAALTSACSQQQSSTIAPGKVTAVAPSNRISVGVIGSGEQGNGMLTNFLYQSGAQVVAVCDVDKGRRDWTAARVDKHYDSKGCAAYNDFRELIARDDIDAVLIATPDHWHVLCATVAAKAGKDIYMEKPLGKTIEEGKILRKAVNRYDTVFQFGTQQRSSRQFRVACELVRNGAIGELKTINVWAPPSSVGGSLKPAPIPEGLDYQMWLGPAPYREYTEKLCASRGADKCWWFVSDFCLGFISGWGIHPVDIALWGGAEKLTGPIEIQGKGKFPAESLCDTATSWNLKLKYRSGVTMNFVSTPPPSDWKERYKRDTGHGTVFEGTEGWVHVDRQGVYVSSQEILDSAKGRDFAELYKSTNHAGNLLDCIKTRAKTICTVEDACAADTICHISDIAIRTKRKLKWDMEKELFVNDDEANRMLSGSMSSPWRL